MCLIIYYTYAMFIKFYIQYYNINVVGIYSVVIYPYKSKN